MKALTLTECEKKYEAAHVAYCKYLDQTAKAKFGQYTAAARAVQRSRAHLQDCIAGRRGIESVRRLVAKVEAVKA